eukprot:Colp12_sorted_trinity150504_noHs@5311
MDFILTPLHSFMDKFYVDYKGQKLGENLYHWIISSFAIVGLVWGYLCQDFKQTFFILMAGFLLSCVLVLPPWPMFRRHPIDWRSPQREPKPVDEQTQSKSNNNNNKGGKGKKK